MKSVKLLSKEGKTLLYNAEKCIGCGLCVDICKNLRNAIEIAYPTKNQEKAEISLDADQCPVCGWCAINCPFGALEFRSSDKPVIVESAETETVMMREIKVQSEKCIYCKQCEKVCPRGAIKINRKLKLITSECVYCNICGEYCPTKAIEVDPASRKVEIDPYSCVHCMICEQLCPKGVIKTFHIRPPNLEETANIPTSSQSERPAWWHISPLALREVAFLEKISRLHVEGSIDIDTDKCVYCGLCELSCPTRAIQVTKPFDGHISIKTAKCQKECSDCINICPSGAIERRKGIVVINEDACIYCGICCRVCPSEAIDFERRSAGIIDNKGNLIMHI